MFSLAMGGASLDGGEGRNPVKPSKAPGGIGSLLNLRAQVGDESSGCPQLGGGKNPCDPKPNGVTLRESCKRQRQGSTQRVTRGGRGGGPWDSPQMLQGVLGRTCPSGREVCK
jgi:hypothetical protein